MLPIGLTIKVGTIKIRKKKMLKRILPYNLILHRCRLPSMAFSEREFKNPQFLKLSLFRNLMLTHLE